MVVCKFFLQGTCRFGENCKFEHQINTGIFEIFCKCAFVMFYFELDHSYGASSSIMVQNYANKPPQNTSTVDTNTLIKAVVNDMISAEKGGQWLLSSYAPFRDKPLFPGFENYSTEEIRYLFYESVKNGTLDQFKQNLIMLLQQAMMKIKALQNPSPDAINMLKKIYNSPPSSSLNQPNPIFGGATQQQNSIFGNASTPPTSRIFGGTAPTTSNQFLGGTPASNPIFAPQQPTQNPSIFGATGTQSIFTNKATTQSTPFGQNAAPQPNIFHQQLGGSTPPVSQFGPQQTQTAQFTPQAQFGVTQTTNSQFGGGNKPAFQHSQSIFGNVGTQQQNVLGGAAQINKPNEEFYSKREDLTEEEIKWFESDDLDVSKIPEKPPTYEMCFKVQ